MSSTNGDESKRGHSDANRVVLLVDMDCFYCQVEEKLNPALKGKPVAVVQYNQWMGGGIIAVNYAARDKGVTRHMRGAEAKKACPELELVSVPSVRGKADLTKYREAGKEVAEVLKSFTDLLQRASVDEAYLDITKTVEEKLSQNYRVTKKDLPNTFIVGNEVEDFLANIYDEPELNRSDLKLAMGAVVTELLRAEVYKKTGYRCSAGIAHNKILAKLSCGLHKPNKQTVLPNAAIPEFYSSLPIHKIKGMGGKFGDDVSDILGIKYMGELSKFSEKQLQKKFDEKSGTWLFNIARGIDTEPVEVRLISKSIGCCKKFPGKTALLTEETVRHWLGELAAEISERLETDKIENNRRAKQIVVSFSQEINKKDVASSRTMSINSYECRKITEDAFDVLKKYCLRPDNSFHIKFLGLSAGNFEDLKKVTSITSFFKVQEKQDVVSDFAQSTQLSGNIDKAKNIAYYFKSLEMAKNTENITFDLNESKFDNNESKRSVYSVSTEEDTDLNRSELVYYDEKIENHTYNESIESESSKDSIRNELSFEKNTPNKIDNNKSSFFANYFLKLDEDNSTRNFNTSKILEESEYSDSNASPLKRLSDVDNEFITCDKCNRKIISNEFDSHLDYHFAIDLVKSESKLSNFNNTDKKPSNTKKTPKRKFAESEGVVSITTFLKGSPKVVDDNCKLCETCKTMVPESEFVAHADYHLAKKMHAEMNQVKTVHVQSNQLNKSTKGKKSASKVGITSISAYFKPV